MTKESNWRHKYRRQLKQYNIFAPGLWTWILDVHVLGMNDVAAGWNVCLIYIFSFIIIFNVLLAGQNHSWGVSIHTHTIYVFIKIYPKLYSFVPKFCFFQFAFIFVLVLLFPKVGGFFSLPYSFIYWLNIYIQNKYT